MDYALLNGAAFNTELTPFKLSEHMPWQENGEVLGTFSSATKFEGLEQAQPPPPKSSIWRMRHLDRSRDFAGGVQNSRPGTGQAADLPGFRNFRSKSPIRTGRP